MAAVCETAAAGVYVTVVLSTRERETNNITFEYFVYLTALSQKKLYYNLSLVGVRYTVIIINYYIATRKIFPKSIPSIITQTHAAGLAPGTACYHKYTCQCLDFKRHSSLS